MYEGGSLGELVVAITTDLSSLNSGLQAADQKVRETTGKITEYTRKIGLSMTVWGTAITGAFALMVKSAVDYNEEIYTVAQRTGIAVETLSELKYVAEQTESSFEGISNSLRFLSRNLYEATTGNTKAAQSFNMLGVSLRDEVTGRFLTAEQMFLRIADKFKTLTDESQKTALAMQIFGRGGQSIIPVLDLGSEGIRELSERAKQLGIVLSTDNAKAINQFNNDMKSFQSSLSGLWINLSQLIIPVLDDFIKKITEVIIQIRKWAEAHPGLSKTMMEWTIVLGVTLTVLGSMLLLLNQLIIAFRNLYIVLGLVLPLTKIFATLQLGGLLTDVTLLIKNFGVLYPLVVLIGTAFASWNIGRWISESTGLDEVLSGPDGVFTHMFTWLDKNEEKLENIQRIMLAIGTFGMSELARKLNENAQPEEAGTIVSTETPAVPEEEAGVESQANDLLRERMLLMEQLTQSEENLATARSQYANQDIMNQQITLDSATNLLNTLQSMHKTIWQGVFDFINVGIKTFSSGFSTAISSIILGTKTASEAFKELGVSMITAIVNFIVEWGVQALLAMTLGTMLAGWVSTVAGSLASAWYPAAELAAIATLGGAVAIGTMAVAGALGTGEALLGLAQPASLFSGEGTVTSSFINVGAAAEGGEGIVDQPTLFLAGEAGAERFKFTPLGKEDNSKDIVINVNMDSPVIASGLDIDELGDQLGENIKRKMKRL